VRRCALHAPVIPPPPARWWRDDEQPYTIAVALVQSSARAESSAHPRVTCPDLLRRFTLDCQLQAHVMSGGMQPRPVAACNVPSIVGPKVEPCMDRLGSAWLGCDSILALHPHKPQSPPGACSAYDSRISELAHAVRAGTPFAWSGGWNGLNLLLDHMVNKFRDRLKCHCGGA